MRVSVFAAPVSWIFVILSLGVTGEAKSNTPGVANDTKPALNSTRFRPGSNSSKGSLSIANRSSKGNASVAAKSSEASITANQSAKKPFNQKSARSEPGFFEPDPNSDPGLGFQDAGQFGHPGGLQQAGSIEYRHNRNSTNSSAQESYIEMSQNNGRIGGVPNTPCSDEMGARVKAMLSTTQTISLNIESLLQFVQRESNKQLQLQSRMDTYDTKLFAIDQKLDQFISDHESTSQNIRHVVRSAEQTTLALTQLRDIENNNGQVLSRMGATGGGMGADLYDTFDALKGTLAKILNEQSTVYNEESMVLSQLQQTVSSIAQNVNNLYDSQSRRGGNSLTIEVMQDYLEKLRQTIVYAFRSEIGSVVRGLDSLNSHTSNDGSLSEQLRVSLESLQNLGTSLTTVSQMVAEIKERVFTGCKIHVKGSSGKRFQLSQGDQAEILRQEIRKHKEASQSKNEEEVSSAWKTDGQTDPQWMRQKK